MTKNLLALLALIGLFCALPARTAEPDSIAGKWHFVFDTPGGDREFNSIFELNADKVTGKWAVSEGRKDGDPVAGTFSAKKLALEFPANSEEVGPGTMKITGQLMDDGTLAGDWSFQDYSGTFKATRLKE
jgi:hypothetical protein